MGAIPYYTYVYCIMDEPLNTGTYVPASFRPWSRRHLHSPRSLLGGLGRVSEISYKVLCRDEVLR